MRIKGIEPWQIKKMWAISKSLGMTSDDLHSMAGVDSLKELDTRTANDIIARLEGLQGTHAPPKPKTTKVHREIVGGATDGQQRKVWALMYELEKYDTEPNLSTVGERLCGIIRKELKIDCLPKKPFIWINFETCNKLIEIIKKYVQNEKRKAGDNK